MIGRPDAWWSFNSLGCPAVDVDPPVFSIDSTAVSLVAGLTLSHMTATSERIQEQTYEGEVKRSGSRALQFKLVMRLCEPPVVRFKYELPGERLLTKPDGKEAVQLAGFAVEPTMARATEVRLFHYNSLAHEYVPIEVDLEAHDVSSQQTVMRPILAWSSGQAGDLQTLAAYEHGSQWPDAYLTFKLDESSVRVIGVRGSHDTDHDLSAKPYQTVWLEDQGQAAVHVQTVHSQLSVAASCLTSVQTLLQHMEQSGASQIMAQCAIPHGDERETNPGRDRCGERDGHRSLRP